MRKDASVVDHFFAPDVEYNVNGTSAPDPAGVLPPISADCGNGLPWLGLHRGREAVKEFLAHMHGNLEVTAFGPREVISEGNKAAAFGWFRLRALSTGRTVDVSYSIRFELQDGLIVKYHFLENTFDVATAFHSGPVVVGNRWREASCSVIARSNSFRRRTKCRSRTQSQLLCRFSHLRPANQGRGRTHT